MSQRHYELLVIGSGPGGQKAAIAAAKLGKHVGLIERKPFLGGAGLQSGTIPSKALREAAFLASRFAAQGMRATLQRHDTKADFMADAVRAKEQVIKGKEAVILNDLLSCGVDIIAGHASFHDAHTVKIGRPNQQEELISADNIVIATGSRPRRPAEVPLDREVILDSTYLLRLQQLPRSLIVVGGGVIACEFATMFAPLGTEVTIVDHHPQILEFLDEDIAGQLREHMQSMGIVIKLATPHENITREGDTAVLHLKDGSRIKADALLYAMGRQPNCDFLELENAGLKPDTRGRIACDDQFRSSVPHIYVIGDLKGYPALASSAFEQGRLVAHYAFNEPVECSPAPLPMAIYTIPELSYVGATEKQLKDQNVDFVVGRANYKGSAKAQIIGDQRGLLKLLADRASRKLLGVHIIGEGASELIHTGQMVLAFGGHVDTLASNVFNYPTLSQTYKTAALNCLDALNEH